MQNTKTNLTFKIIENIDHIPVQEWERLFSDDVVEGFGYHKTIEKSGTKEFRIFYLVGKKDEKYVAIIPFFVNDFSFTTIIQGPLQKVMFGIQKVFKRAFKAKMLFVGLPTAEELYIGIDPSCDYLELAEKAINEFSGFCRREKILAILFYNLTNRHELLAKLLKKRGFSLMENFPNTTLTIREKSCEEYINKLSKNTKKDIRRKLNRLYELTTLKTEIIEDIKPIKNRIYELYMNNFDDSDIHFETLTPDFFENISVNMPGTAKFFITRDHNQEIVAFNLCFIRNNLCIDKIVGFDKELSRKYHLYNATLVHNIDWCIKNNITYYQMGITDYHAKLRFGATLTPLSIYVAINNSLLNSIFTKPIAKLTQPKNFDPVLRRLEKNIRFTARQDTAENPA